MKFFFKIVILLFGLSVYGQSPDWSVNASDYQFTMTFTTFLNVNGTTLISANDKVGAFVNNIPRGEAHVVYNTNANKYVAYLTVLSNTPGETITFKIYDSQNDAIVDVVKTQPFVIDGNVGGIFQTFSVANPTLLSDTEISSFSFLNLANTNTTISNDEINVIVPSITDITSLTPVFNVTNNGLVFYQKSKQTSGNSTIDFTNEIVFEVLSEDESTIKTYNINVFKQDSSSSPSIILSTNQTTFNSMPVKITLTTQNTITDLEKEDFIVENCFVYNISTSDNINFNLDVVALNQGDLSVKLPENKVINSDNKGNLSSNNLIISFDNEAPIITGILRQNPTKELSNASQVNFSVLFNEAVENVTSDDFLSVVNTTISISKESSSKYLVTVSNLSNFTGNVSLQLSENNDITDFSANKLQFIKYQYYEK